MVLITFFIRFFISIQQHIASVTHAKQFLQIDCFSSVKYDIYLAQFFICLRLSWRSQQSSGETLVLGGLLTTCGTEGHRPSAIRMQRLILPSHPSVSLSVSPSVCEYLPCLGPLPGLQVPLLSLAPRNRLPAPSQASNPLSQVPRPMSETPRTLGHQRRPPGQAARSPGPQAKGLT